MSNKINKPEEKTYFIAYDKRGLNIKDRVFATGEVAINQRMDTGLKTMETFTDEKLYQNRLDELGIQIEDDITWHK